MIRNKAGIEIPTSLEDWCDPGRMALIVYDMQVGICRQVEGSGAIIERVGTVLEAARTAGMRVAFTRHLSLPRRWMWRDAAAHRNGLAATGRCGRGRALVPA